MSRAKRKSRARAIPEKDPEASEYPEPGTRAAEKAADTSRSPRHWYTPMEIAKLCGVTKSAVTYWARTGKLERVPNRGRWLNFTSEALTRACTRGKIRALTSGYIGR